MNFKVGDKVKCIEGSGSSLIFNNIYTVTKVHTEHLCLKETVSGNSWYKYRFIKVNVIKRNLPEWW